MKRLVFPEKFEQICQVLTEKNIGLWLVMGRETVDVADPAIRLVLPVDIMGVSAFFFTPDGKKLALVRNQDVTGVEQTGIYDKVMGYGTDFDEQLRDTILSIAPNVIDVNADLYDPLTDGLTTGLYLRLLKALEGTGYEKKIQLGEAIRTIRGCKVKPEYEKQAECLKLLNQCCAELQDYVKIGTTEEDVYDYCQNFMKEHDMVSSWDNYCCPLVHMGARSVQAMVHAGKNDMRPGDTFHLSFGAKLDGYATDFQRTWYVLEPGETEAPEEVRKAFELIRDTIEYVRTHLQVGIQGREVDAMARERMAAAGFTYSRGCGHSVGMALHDGCFQLCQDTPVFGELPARPLEENNVFTIELFADTSRGVVAMEEMMRLTPNGGEFLYKPQTELWYIKSES